MGFRASSDAWGQIVVRARSIQDEISHRVWLAQLASPRLATRTRCRGMQGRHVLNSTRCEIVPKRNWLQQSTLPETHLPARTAVHTFKKTKGAIIWDVCSNPTQEFLFYLLSTQVNADTSSAMSVSPPSTIFGCMAVWAIHQIANITAPTLILTRQDPEIKNSGATEDSLLLEGSHFFFSIFV